MCVSPKILQNVDKYCAMFLRWEQWPMNRCQFFDGLLLVNFDFGSFVEILRILTRRFFTIHVELSEWSLMRFNSFRTFDKWQSKSREPSSSERLNFVPWESKSSQFQKNVFQSQQIQILIVHHHHNFWISSTCSRCWFQCTIVWLS